MTKVTMASAPTAERVIRIRLTCEAPPIRPGTDFGLQDKAGELARGEPQGDGSTLFAGDIRSVTAADGTVRLRGPIVHGPPSAPFLYLSCRPAGSPAAPWLFRLKVPLTGIDPAANVLEARVRATRGGSVPLIGGWRRAAT